MAGGGEWRQRMAIGGKRKRNGENKAMAWRMRGARGGGAATVSESGVTASKAAASAAAKSWRRRMMAGVMKQREK